MFRETVFLFFFVVVVVFFYGGEGVLTFIFQVLGKLIDRLVCWLIWV